MTVESWPISRVKPFDRNARKIPQSAVDKVALSIQEFGWQQPIVVDVEGVVVAGHTRRLSALQLKLTEVPVVVASHLTAAQIRAYRLMDNRSHDEAKWDVEIAGLELGELRGLGMDLTMTGFSLNEIGKLSPITGLTDPDEVPALETEVITHPGDLWILGGHRVLCGDSTAEIPFEHCDLLWTDPPYGVNYVGKTKDALKITNDGPAGLKALIDAALLRCGACLKESSPFYIAHPPGALYLIFGNAVREAGWQIHQNLIWLKDSMVLGHSDYHFRHEPILYGFIPGPGRSGRGNHTGSKWYGTHSETSVFEIPRPKRSAEHPTMKPVELVERCVQNSSSNGDLILDPFGGSGTTLIACEKTGRNARIVEIDPTYVDLIVRRWQSFTGKQATLESSGETFDSIAESRTGAAV